MNTRNLAILGRGTRTPKPTVANRNREMSRLNYLAALANDVPVLITELHAHGCIHRACMTAGVTKGMLSSWCQRDALLNQDVRRAVRFARSDAVNYRAWLEAK